MLTTTIAAVSISEGGTREEAGDNNGNYTRFRTTVDMGSQKRLRERWNAFMAERAKGISFDQKARRVKNPLPQFEFDIPPAGPHRK